MTVPHDIADPSQIEEGVRRIEWAAREMPVLKLIGERFAQGAAAARDQAWRAVCT